MRPNYRVNRIFAALFALAFIVTPALAQQVQTYKLDPESKLWIDGTSTRSDWTVQAEDIEGNFGLVGNGSDLQIRNAQFAVRASEIVSGRSTIMDRLIDDALKAEEHPVIRYDLSSAEANGEMKYNTKGKLTLGGQTKDIEMVVEAVPLDGGKVRFKGSHDLKMSDYGLEAPVAMFGALRTGDEVTVQFDVVAAPAN